MKQVQYSLKAETRGKGFLDITDQVASWIWEQKIDTGLLTLYIVHTSASLVIQENADPSVLRDMESFFQKLVPEDSSLYHHSMEGPDDMPAHIRCALTQTHLNIPVTDGKLALGTWQGIFLYEHRSRPHSRKLLLHLIGE
jgi:secondary thiamine-phosphate synthase enzyme